MGKRRVWILMASIALLAIGCGGASAGKAAESPPAMGAMEPGTAADRDGDGIPDAQDEADTETHLYRAPTADAPAREMRAEPVAQAQPMPTKAGAPSPAPDAAGGEAAQPTPTVDTGSEGKLAGPLLIYTANLHVAVFESKKAIDRAEQIAKGLGGYLVRRDDTSITVRVPAGKFDGALAEMLKLGDILHRDVSVRDVTAEYFDMQVRLKNAEAVRDRLQELLKKAANVTEAIQVERELARVTGEIESMKGRLKLLRELIIFSTITLRFQPRPVESIDSRVRLPFPWLDQLGLSNLLRL
jgi:hypothetical protein